MSEVFWEAKDKGGDTECELKKIDDSTFLICMDNSTAWTALCAELDRNDLKDLHDAIEHLMGWRNDGTVPPPKESG